MSDDLYFEGDPSHDSVRRRMERLLAPTPRTVGKAAVAGVTAWGVWRLLRALMRKFYTH